MLAIVIAFHPRPCGSFSSSDYPSSLWQPLLPAIARGAGGSDRCHRNERSLIGHEIARRRSRNRNRLVARGPPLASSSAKQTSAPSRPPKNYCFRSDGGADCAGRSGRRRHRRPARIAAGTAEVTARLQRLGQADNVVRLYRENSADLAGAAKAGPGLAGDGLDQLTGRHRAPPYMS
jgi:hypothetical protein